MTNDDTKSGQIEVKSSTAFYRWLARASAVLYGLIPTIFFGNSYLIGKAIIEAAWQANPNVVIDSTLISTFSKPPYDIFKS